MKTNRRSFFQFLSGLPVVGGLCGGAGRAAAATTPSRDFLKELGVRPVINGTGVYTMLGGTLMLPEVVAAFGAIAGSVVRLDELHDAVGKRIAKLLGAEAAMVPAGAAAALTLGTAACITGTDPDKIKRIPDLTGMKSEVVIQKAHRYPYDHAVRNCGVRLVEIESAAELEKAIGPRTAMMLFLNKADPLGAIKVADWVAIGKRRGIPTFNDAAADVPPVGNLTRYIKMGFDLVTFSGGKGMRGPQSAGLLLGRPDLIAAARLQTGANSDSIGRPLKISKEEMVAMMVAVESYLRRDHKADWRVWEQNIVDARNALGTIPGVTAVRFVPVIANEVPHLRVSWDRARLPQTPEGVALRLRDGTPSIELVQSLDVPGTLEVASWTLRPGEASVLGKRLREVLREARS